MNKFKEVIREARRLKAAEKYKDRNKKIGAKVKRSRKELDNEEWS